MIVLAVAAMSVSITSCKGASRQEGRQPGATEREVALAVEEVDDEAMDVDAAEEVAVDAEEEVDTVVVDEKTPPMLPSFVRRQLPYADWEPTTVCTIGRRSYFTAYETFSRLHTLYDRDRILVADPTLRLDSFAHANEHKFYVSVVGDTRLVDFADRNSLQALDGLGRKLPGVTRFRLDTVAQVGQKDVFFGLEVDFPRPFVPHAERIGRWLAGKMMEPHAYERYSPSLDTYHIGYKKQADGHWHYEGNIYAHKRLARCASDVYFTLTRREQYGDEEEMPAFLFSVLSLRAGTVSDRFVSYRFFTHSYGGGAHGYYTERLTSFDPVNNREIDYDYLFKPGVEEEMLTILKEEARKTSQYKEWEPDIDQGIFITDRDGNRTGEYDFPRPGLTETGIVFSFQPYDISCFAAGAFHFTIPYERLRDLLTPAGRRCAGLDGQ